MPSKRLERIRLDHNGSHSPFNLTELQALDTELANACLDYLNYDRLSRRDVHRHLSSGDAELHRWIEDYGLRPRSIPME